MPYNSLITLTKQITMDEIEDQAGMMNILTSAHLNRPDPNETIEIKDNGKSS